MPAELSTRIVKPVPFFLIMSASILAPVTVGLFYFGRLQEWGRILTVIAGLGAVTEVSAYLVAKIIGTNVTVYYLYIAALLAAYGVFFGRINHQLAFNRIGLSLMAVPLLEYVLLPALKFPSLSYLVLDVAVVVSCVHSFQRISIGEISDRSLIALGVVLCYFLTSFIYLSYHRWSENGAVLAYISTLWIYINAICNLGFAFVLWKSKSFSSL